MSDSNDFKTAMANLGVKPLKPQNKVAPTPKKPKLRHTATSPMSSHIKPTAHHKILDCVDRQITDTQSIAIENKSLSPKQFSKLKKGLLSPQASIDLHTTDSVNQAKELLLNFIYNQYGTKKRVILVIHGKGGQFGKAPELKNQCIHWLKQLSCVLAFCSALPKDGGTGALYVLLKKR